MTTIAGTATAGTSPAGTAAAGQPGPAPALSVVVPVRDEADNILPLLAELYAALAAGPAFEVICVDDGSRDATADRLAEAGRTWPRLRRLRHRESNGQSAAIRSGVLAAAGRIVITLDGDGQNDPADIPGLLAALTAAGASPHLAMAAGCRRQRQDRVSKRLASRWANALRRAVLQDGTADSGCGLKAFYRSAFLRLPFFNHMHRFLPALMRREGFRIVQVTVNDRARRRGRSKYGNLGRAAAGFIDLMGVVWLILRKRVPAVEELS